jgi:hypothetical protein
MRPLWLSRGRGQEPYKGVISIFSLTTDNSPAGLVLGNYIIILHSLLSLFFSQSGTGYTKET